MTQRRRDGAGAALVRVELRVGSEVPQQQVTQLSGPLSTSCLQPRARTDFLGPDVEVRCPRAGRSDVERRAHGGLRRAIVEDSETR